MVIKDQKRQRQKKLKEIISLYEKFVSITNRQTLHRDLGRIREFAEKKLEKNDI